MPYLGVKPADEFTSKDLNGAELILDADADTTITADTDDQIDIRIAGADDFQFTANTFTAQSGSTIAAQALTATLITPSLPITYSNEIGITAGTTQTQAGGTALTKEINTVTAVGTDGDGVKLPTVAAGLRVTVYNYDSAQYLHVWPNTSDRIGTASVDAVDPDPIGPGAWRTYGGTSTVVWEVVGQKTEYYNGTFDRDMTAATGTQAVTGPTFKPTVLMVMGASAGQVGEMSMGHATANGTASWLANRDGVLDNTWWPDSNGNFIVAYESSGALQNGALNSFDARGFTVGWVKTGTPSAGNYTTKYVAMRI